MRTLSDIKTLLDILNSKSEKTEGEHRLYKGTLNKAGYGTIRIEGRDYLVHRLSAYIHGALETIYNDKLVLHKDELCRHKNCWEIDHLYIGTYDDNNKDASKFGSFVSDYCKNGHKFTDGNTYIYYVNGFRHRACKICKEARKRKYRNRKW